MRVATWNMKQLAPRQPLDERWRWIAEEINPDVIVLTEAKVPDGGPPPGWEVLWVDGGMGPRRRWGTVIAGRGVELREINHVSRAQGTVLIGLETTWPAAVRIADVLVGGERWATVVGLYGVTQTPEGEKCGHGRASVPHLLEQLDPLLYGARKDRVIVAGDFNLHPIDMPRAIDRYRLTDLVEYTAVDRPALEGCTGCNLGRRCGHMWTHKNTNNPGAAVQNIDYILATKQLRRELVEVTGGIRDFPGVWEVSDHAPVVADFA